MTHDPDEPEPLPWLRSKSPASRYSLPGLRYPLGSLIYGLIFLALSVWAVFAGLALTGAGRATVLLIALIPAALGTRLIYIAARRWGWYRRYVQRNGHRPF